MADIELVVKIPEEMYAEIMDENGIETMLIPYSSIVRNGVPLPKGHGRLIDADALGEKLNRYTEAPYQYALRVFNESPIIINAESEG